MNKLECDGVYFGFGLRPILTSVYLKCGTGQVVGLLGRNGSGKSCLMKIIFGSLKAESKSVRINDKPITGFTTKNSIAYLSQDHFIPSSLAIKEAFNIYKASPNALINYFPDFKDYLSLKPRQISGGVLRIIEIMLIMGLDRKFVLLDEPYAGIMPAHVDTLKQYFIDQKNEKGIIISDHLHRHVTSIADKIYVLTNGSLYAIKDESQLITYGYLNG